jgi:hypothetical protein
LSGFDGNVAGSSPVTLKVNKAGLRKLFSVGPNVTIKLPVSASWLTSALTVIGSETEFGGKRRLMSILIIPFADS